ncbi:MAG TPA: spore coat U domain-containing protein [Caulobacteraceae bacterium]
MKRVVLAALTLGGLAFAGAAHAQTANGNLSVNATVANYCSVNSPTLSFGTSVNPLSGSDTDATATIDVTCTIGTAFAVGLGNGAHYTGGLRHMQIGATTNQLVYELYRDAGYAERFGDTGSTDRSPGVGAGNAATPITVYGRIPSGQTTAAVGAYTDTVAIVVRY